MLTINHSNKAICLSVVLFIGLLFLSGCKRSTFQASNTNVVPGLSQPVRVSSSDTDAAEPAIATAPDGSFYLVWVNHGPKSQADVMIAHFNIEGQMQAPPVRVNDQPGTATAWRGDPPTVVIAADQTVFVGWTKQVESESGHATDIYLSSSRDFGQTFPVAVKVNDDTKPAVHGMHSLAIGKDGRIYVAWLDERNLKPIAMKDMKMNASTSGHHMESNRELFFSFSTDGGHTFARNQRVVTNACPCCKTALAVSSDGHLYVSWRQVLPGDLRHIAVSSSIDQGKTFSPAVIVSDDQWVLAGCPVSGSSLSVDNNGTLSVLWFSAGKNGETGLYWSQSKNYGANFGSRQLVRAGLIKGTPVLLATDDGFTGVWEGIAGGSTVLSARLDTQAISSDSLSIASDAELPAAAATRVAIVIAYVVKDDQHQGVWVVLERQL